MKKQSRILFTSVSYSALMLTLSFSPSVADITINAGGTSGTNLEINSVDVSEASSEQKAVGTTWVDEGDGSGLTQTDIKESLRAYYLNVEEDQKTYTGNIVVTDGANVTIAPYDIKVQGGAEDEGTPGKEDALRYDFSKNALFVLNGTSSIYSQNGGRITIAPMRADEDSPVQGDADITLEDNASLLARGAKAGSTSSSSTGQLTVTDGTFTLSGNSKLGGSYGVGRNFKDTGGTVQINGGTFTLLDAASLVQEGSGNLIFSAEENGTGATVALQEKDTKIVHSGGTGNLQIQAGNFALFDGAQIVRGGSQAGNATEGDIVISGGQIKLSGSSSIVMGSQNTGNITFASNSSLTAISYDNRTTAVSHQGSGSISFSTGTTVDLMEADINSGNNATIAISGGTFNLNNSSLISGKQTITVSDGEFEMQGGSFVRQTGEGSIIFSMPGESASTSGIIFKAANGGIEHTGSTGSITIQSGTYTFTSADSGIFKGADGTQTTGGVTVSGQDTSLTFVSGSKIQFSDSNSGTFSVTGATLSLDGSLLNNANGSVSFADDATVTVSNNSSVTFKDLSINNAALTAGDSSLSGSGAISFTSGTVSLTDSLVTSQTSGNNITIGGDTGGPDLTVTASSGGVEARSATQAGLVHSGTGSISIINGTIALNGAGASVFKGGTGETVGDFNISGGTINVNSGMLGMSAANVGSINISGGDITFSGTESSLAAQGGQNINFSGGSMTTDQQLNIQGNLALTGNAALNGTGTLNFQNGGGITFGESWAQGTWGGNITLDTGSASLGRDTQIAGNFTAGNALSLNNNVLTVGGTSTFKGGSSMSLMMNDTTDFGKIIT